MKRCVLNPHKICDGCNQCNRCDLDPTKLCDNCFRCLDQAAQMEYARIPISRVIMGESALPEALDEDSMVEEAPPYAVLCTTLRGVRGRRGGGRG